MVTANQIVCHLIGDYVIQSDWMASEKTKRSLPALLHVLCYGLVFLVLSPSWTALAVIVGTHFLIDRFRLIRYVCWAKNFLGPRGANKPWAECKGTGYDPDKPAWLTVWLMIITDNILHIVINALALAYL